jgi:hypothetical protein
VNAAEHIVKAEELTAKAEKFLADADSAITTGERTGLLMKAYYSNAVATTHIHLAELAKQAEADAG